MNERHRPSERLAPRPSDRIADRLYVVAAWATRARVTVCVDDEKLGGPELFELAGAQESAETELLDLFSTFREHYARYTARLAKLEQLLASAIAEMERHAAEPATRAALRLSRLRRPPLAKVREAVTRARAAG